MWRLQHLLVFFSFSPGWPQFFCDVVICLFVKQGRSKVIDHVRVNASPAITAWSIVSRASYNYFSLHRVCCIVPLHCVALSPVLWNKSSSHHVTITNCTCPHQDRNANYYENVFLKLVVFLCLGWTTKFLNRRFVPAFSHVNANIIHNMKDIHSSISSKMTTWFSDPS